MPALVGQYLHQIGSCVARPFSLEFQPREVDFCLEEVVRSYREESRVVVDRQWDSLVNSLVYGHLLKVSPGMAEEFREHVQCSRTEHELEHFVAILEKCYQTIVIKENNYEELPIIGNIICNAKMAPPLIKQNIGSFTDIANKSRESLGRFNPQEDEVILTEGSGGKDWGKLATILGRKKACVQQRYERLKTDVGGMKRYTLQSPPPAPSMASQAPS